jgi:hypothetical protein
MPDGISRVTSLVSWFPSNRSGEFKIKAQPRFVYSPADHVVLVRVLPRGHAARGNIQIVFHIVLDEEGLVAAADFVTPIGVHARYNEPFEAPEFRRRPIT